MFIFEILASILHGRTMFRLRNFNNKESNVGNKNMKVKHDMGNTPSRAILFVIYSIYIYEYEHDTYAHQAVSVWM